MRKYTFFMIIILTLLFARQASAVYSCGEMDKDDDGHRHHVLSFLVESNLFDARFVLEVKDQINLSKQQQEKIENLMLAHESSVIRNSAEIKVKELQFVTYLRSGEMKRAQVETFIREISAGKSDMIIEYVNHLLDIRSILNPSQRQKLKEIRKKMFPEPDDSPQAPPGLD